MNNFQTSTLAVSQFDDIVLFSDEYITDDFLLTGRFDNFDSNQDIFSNLIPIANEIPICREKVSVSFNSSNSLKKSNSGSYVKRKAVDRSTSSGSDVKSYAPSQVTNNKNNKKRTNTSPLLMAVDNIEELRVKLPRKEFIRSLFPPDLRYSYGRIIVDAFNTLNERLLGSAISSFCTPDCSVKEFFSGMGPNPYGPRYREVGGLTTIVNYWGVVASAYPDCVMEVHDTQAKFLSSIPDNFTGYVEALNNEDRTDSGSEGSQEPCVETQYPGDGLVFVLRYTFTGTKLFDIITDQKKRLPLCYASGPDAPEYGAMDIQMVPFNNQRDNTNVHPDIKLQGYWVIALNKDNKIKSFEFHYRNGFEST